ncbi:4'-phosphopantetheinyl transferase [Gloeothece citriformis PCC 7424]|uniref:4'-phosphopantetheinyl transferase n=1 Tax=Gloeothece citriformis (strain PCC 7424) TaxID=65393 RepID=B7KJI4_GLOC7|nr:4'-phosphopantetheinyl transferase superfamily protein [Gloeothece citriformis]ACK73661.1 4'-phosphopantetheinyl transferase [Gloeothece citriformis PCC 7424]
MKQIWSIPPQDLKLEENEVHIWCTHLDLPAEKIQQLETILSEEEINRANRFYFEKHRHRFIVARSSLRIILGQYLKIKSDRLQFDYSPKGKPSLVGGGGIKFNLSHSENMSLYGITRNSLIGVDIEYLRPVEDVAKLAQRFFCPREYEVISSLASGEIEKAFFRAWTAKEAFLKATGEGIGGGLDQVEIDLTTQESVKFLKIGNHTEAVNEWSLFPLMPAEGYIGAVVVKGKELVKNFYKLEN